MNESICYECKNINNIDKCKEIIRRDGNGNITTCKNFVTFEYDKRKRHERLTKSIHDMYVAKNADYGDSFSKLYNKFGLRSSQIRLHDKLFRFDKLIDNDGLVKSESIKDTLLDMANYCIMTVIELEQIEEKKRKK